MDSGTVATAVVASLVPYLAQGSKAAAQAAGKALAASLEQRLKGRPAGLEAWNDLKAAPNDADAQSALRVQLKKAFAADPALLAELSQWVGPGAVVARDIHAPVATSGGIAAGGDVVLAQGSAVQVGGIRAGRIDAHNVVDGVQMQGGAAEAADLVGLARAIRRGGISAEQIQAGNVVSGLQFIAGTAPNSTGELRREIAALREQVQQAIAVGEIPKPGDAQDVQEALQTAEDELQKPQPDGERVVRKLEVVNTILTRCAEVVESAGKVGQQVLTLAPIAAALWALAQKILGG